MCYQILMTIASFQIVKDLPKDSYGLVFGINAFFGVGCQTILTSIVNAWLGIEPAPQFIIYGGFYAFILVMYIPVLILDIMKFRRRRTYQDQN